MNEDRFDSNGNYKIFKGVNLELRKSYRKRLSKQLAGMKIGDSVKADSAHESARIYSAMRNLGFKASQYKTGQGFWWIQRIK